MWFIEKMFFAYWSLFATGHSTINHYTEVLCAWILINYSPFKLFLNIKTHKPGSISNIISNFSVMRECVLFYFIHICTELSDANMAASRKPCTAAGCSDHCVHIPLDGNAVSLSLKAAVTRYKSPFLSAWCGWKVDWSLRWHSSK